MTSTFSEAEVRASVDTFREYLDSYKIELDRIAPDLAVETDSERGAVVRGLPVVDGRSVLDLTAKKITRKLILPLHLECDVLILHKTLVSGIVNLPSGLVELDISKNARFKRCPTNLPDTLRKLNVSRTKVTELVDLPSGLTELAFEDCDVSNFPSAPAGLTVLRAWNNKLEYLPELPNGLEHLHCSSNPLKDLPELPVSLQTLHCGDQFPEMSSPPDFPDGLIELHWYHLDDKTPMQLPATLTKLCLNVSAPVTLPDSLEELALFGGPAAFVPELPDGIERLSWCHEGQPGKLPLSLVDLSFRGPSKNLTMPSLPPNLVRLACSDCGLTELPELPASLETLWCPENQLTVLPELPEVMTMLNCEENLLTELPQLPKCLTHLRCGHNQLTELPRLDRWWDDVDTSTSYSGEQGLRWIECFHNSLTTIPTLPKGLDSLRCNNNRIESLPPIPIGATYLNCSHNQLRKLTHLPPKLYCLFFNNNPALTYVDTVASEGFDRLFKHNGTKTNLDEETAERLRLWGVRID